MKLHWNDTTIGVRGGGAGRAAAPPGILKIAIFGQQKSGNIRAKPLDFRASNGEDIRATDLSPPKRNWSRTPMDTTPHHILSMLVP